MNRSSTGTTRGWTLSMLFAASVLGACSDENNPLAAVCCNEFKVGADLSSVDFGLEGEVRGQFVAFAQASSDLAATAADALADVEAACRDIAVELGASTADVDAASARDARDRVTGLCALASAQIRARVTAAGRVTVAFEPPTCEVSVQARARCEGQCSASGTCDVKANPPVCRGGRLEVSCRGECTAQAGATLHCEGTCTGNCQGSCAAEGGVRCNGRCDGTCTAEGSASGQAFDAQGNCVGTCNGTCEATPPGVTCQGSCNGQCDAACRAEGNASVTCDGTCSGDFEPLRCEGGTLEGGCNVDANCKASCDASASARATCRPPRVAVELEGTASADVRRSLEVLERTLPALLVVARARGQAFVDLLGSLSGSAGATGSAFVSGDLGVRATACLAPIAATIGDAAANARVSLEASANVLGSLDVR